MLSEKECNKFNRELGERFFADKNKPQWMNCSTQWTASLVAELEAKLEKAERDKTSLFDHGKALEADNAALIQTGNDLARANAELEAENERLRELVHRMFIHCTEEKGEMTQAELDEWLEQAAALEKKDYVDVDGTRIVLLAEDKD